MASITALDCGWLRTQARSLSQQGTKDEQRFPVPSWLVQHHLGTVVLSHCHFDHVGGLCELPNAQVIIQADEWAAATGPDDVAYDKSLFELGHDVLVIHGAHDLFGDGTVACIPTPGHTCGHQSLRVVTAAGPVILTADACYFSHTLDDEVLPPFAFDFDQQRASLDFLREQRDGGTAIIPGHDTDVFTRVLNAPL